MSKKYYRFFGGLLTAQEKWLNKMADNGYRLVCVGKLLYAFEKCEPGEVQYRVEFIGKKSKDQAKEYCGFLEDMGYKVFYKNINLNYCVGKVRWRPWADKGGQIATNATVFNKELLLVEKQNDGKVFELHTTFEDKQNYYKALRSPYLFLFAMAVALCIITQTWLWTILIPLALIPLIMYQVEIIWLKAQAKAKEW